MKKLILASLVLGSLFGCASPDYDKYTDAQIKISEAKSTAETARFNALKEFANTGSDSSKVAAVMALAFANQGGGTGTTQIAAPQPNQALQWASILIPAVTQAYSIAKNADVAIASSNNAMATSVATTNAFVGIAGKIQAPVANVSTVDSHNTSADQSLSGTGTLGSGSYAANPTSTTSTLSGTGTLGSGAYSPSTATTDTVTNPPTVTTVPAGKTCSINSLGVVNCI